MREIYQSSIGQQETAGSLMRLYELFQDTIAEGNADRQRHCLPTLTPLPSLYGNGKKHLRFDWIEGGAKHAVRFEAGQDNLVTVKVEISHIQHNTRTLLRTSAEVDWLYMHGDRNDIPQDLRRAYQIAQNASHDSLKRTFVYVKTTEAPLKFVV